LRILCGVALAVAIYVVYFFHLTALGIAGTDEPRYAAIGREMALSGHWITPILWGRAWFEKPPLIYWMTAIGFRLGLSQDLAPRLPVALLSVVFLLFYYWILRREFGFRAALYSVVLLGSSALWIGFSQAAVPDLPLAVFFSAAVLLALPWLGPGDGRLLPYAAAMLGLAVLAKSLVPLVLLIPIFWFGRKRLTDLLRPRVLFTFFVVALPWYAACYARNGMPFIQTLFLEHQVGRFTSDALQHVQKFWYYLAVLPGAVYPWVFLLPLLFHRKLYEDVRARFLLTIFLFGFIFFSASTNKLPGYILPLLPPLIALIGIRLAQTKFAGELMMCCTMLLVFIPAIAMMLPKAMAQGISYAYPVDTAAMASAGLLIPLLIMIGGAEILAARKWRHEAAILIAGSLVVCSILYLKIATLPELDKVISARGRVPECIKPETTRAMRYGFNYYAGTIVPDCRTQEP
jgi:4-amino-4-deoxy-L-arabinose transferase-like glycosyltransferase